MATVKGPEGNPFGGEAEIPHPTDANGTTTEGGVPNDDESAQQPVGYNSPPEAEGPTSSAGDGDTAAANYVATDGDEQGSGRTTQDIKDRRVVDEDAPFDYSAVVDDTSTAQGNLYPPGPDFYKAELARAEQAKLDAERAAEEAQAALDEAQKAHDDNVGNGEDNSRTVEAVHENEDD